MGGSKVNEKDLVILEQYDLHVQSTKGEGVAPFFVIRTEGLFR